jgi:hypothetical protein
MNMIDMQLVWLSDEMGVKPELNWFSQDAAK